MALIFDCSEPQVFEDFVLARMGQRAKATGADQLDTSIVRQSTGPGTPEVLRLRGAFTADRGLSAWIVRAGDVVVVANSRPLLERIVATSTQAGASLFELPEYRWFRQRYARGEDDEVAFVMVPDGAIRRWCGPEWRIASARRVKAAALLSEAQASLVAQNLGLEPEQPLKLAAAVPRLRRGGGRGPRTALGALWKCRLPDTRSPSSA